MAKEVTSSDAAIWKIEYTGGTETMLASLREKDKLLEQVYEKSASLKPGEVVGALLQWQRGDGYAFYRVVKARPLTVQHVPYGDGWRVEQALIRGLKTQDVLDQLAQRRRHSALFPATKLHT
jgi:hypothetical protein